MYRFFKGIFCMQRRIVPVWSRPLTNISECVPPSDLLPVLQNDSDVEVGTDKRQKDGERTPLFRVVKFVVIPPSSEASVSVTITSPRLFYMVPDLKSMGNRLVLTTSGITNALSHVPIPICLAKLLKTPTTLAKDMPIGVGAYLLDLIIHLDQVKPIPSEERKEWVKPDADIVSAVE